MSACRATNSRSSRSFAVSAASSSALSGRLMPLSAASFSPSSRATVICTWTSSCWTCRITPPMRPSSNHTRSPGRTWASTSGSVQGMEAGRTTRPWSSSFAGRPRPCRVSTSMSPLCSRSAFSTAGTPSTGVSLPGALADPRRSCRTVPGSTYAVCLHSAQRSAPCASRDRQRAGSPSRIDQLDAIALCQTREPCGARPRASSLPPARSRVRAAVGCGRVRARGRTRRAAGAT